MDFLVGSDRKLSQEVVLGHAIEVGQGQELYKLSTVALNNRDKLIGKSIVLADLGLSGVEQGIMLAGLNLPNGTNTVFKATAIIIAGADVYHSIMRDDSNGFDIAIASAKTIALATDFVAPFVPLLTSYQQQLSFITVLLKAAGTTKEIVALTCKVDNSELLHIQ